jgi:hypothetical protein
VEIVAEAVMTAIAAANTPEVDVELLKRGAQRRDEYRQRCWQDARRRRQEALDQEIGGRNKEWNDWYERYLQTYAWGERRRLVMERAGGICEGCRQEPATEVHHLTYKHVGDEFLWELVAVCGWCHSRYHEARHG